MAFNLGDIFVTFKAKSEGFQAAIDNVKNAGEKIKGVSEKIHDFGEKSTRIGGTLTKTMTLPILAAGAAAIKMSTDFNGAMANIATLIPKNTTRVNELKASIQDMAIQTGKSTNDLAAGMYQVISAFGDTAESAKILEINAKSAKAGLAETTDAINLTSSVTKAYGDTTAAAVTKASDLALMTVRLGQTTFPELAASLGRVTPLAAALNVKQEELFGTMATFTGVTGGAAEVSTQLRGVLQALMAPTADVQKLMKKLGYANGEAMVKGMGLQGTIEALVKGAKDSGQPLQAFIGSIEGQTLALAATGGQAATFTEKIKAMGDVAGTTDVAFNEVTNGVNKAGFSMEQAKAKAEVAAQKMGDALAPALAKVADWVGKVADWFIKLDPNAQKMILTIAGIAAAIGPLLILLGQMAMGLSLIGTILTFLSLNPVVLIVTGILLAIAAIAIVIYKNWDTLKAFFIGLFNWVAQNWPLLLAILTGPFGIAVLAIIRNWESIKGFFSGLVSAIGRIFMGVVNLIVAPYRQAFNMIAALWNGTVGKLSFKAPNWVPGIGGKGFEMPKLPMLAQGGVVDKATLAVIGEGNEPEAVIPLSKIGQVAASMGATPGPQGNTYHIHLQGVMARSKSELRDIMMEGIAAVDERLAAQGKPTIIRAR